MVTPAIEGTAAPAADTAATEPAPPQEAPATETAAPQATETASTAATETDTSPSPATPPDPFADLDEDALRNHPRVKDILARDGESIRQRSQREAGEQRARAERDWARKGEFVGDLTGLLQRGARVGDDGSLQVDLDRKGLTEITGRLLNVATMASVDALSAVVDASLPEGFTLTKEETDALRESYAAFQADPGQARDFVSAQLDLFKRAAVADAEAEIRKDERAKARKEFAAEQEVAGRREADAANREGGGPTRVDGGAAGGPNIQTMADADGAYADGSIDLARYKGFRKQFGLDS